MELSLAELARHLGAELRGDGDVMIRGVGSLHQSGEDQVSFIANSGYLVHLEETRAAAVIVTAAMADKAPCAALIVDDPYLCFARTTQIFDNRPRREPGVHPTAVVDSSCRIGTDVYIGPNVVVGPGCVIGDSSEIWPGTVIGDNCIIGSSCVLNANVTLYHGVTLGNQVRVQSGTVIGGDGFGYAPNKGKWERIAQLGGVQIGDNVEIGANTCIDRGALGDTVIANNVILDNLIQIAHNVKIGEGTAIAGCVGIAGSTDVGKNCTLAGGVGLTGHIKITDGVHISGMSLVTNSILESGAYASGTSHMPVHEWRRSAARFKQLDSMAKRLQKLEKSQEGKA
jgi:UDP-3-O-[3-hydroxymyristoyl] glucosamine N-acyltransferase